MLRVGLQTADGKPSISIGRGRTICEYDKIMQILSRLERQYIAYKSITGNLQNDGGSAQSWSGTNLV